MGESLVSLVFVEEALDDSQLGFNLRRLDINGSALVEARMVALIDIDVTRRAVGRENNLLSLVGQLVEDLEYDVERLLLTLKILDIVNEQDISLFVTRLEVSVA